MLGHRALISIGAPPHLPKPLIPCRFHISLEPSRSGRCLNCLISLAGPHRSLTAWIPSRYLTGAQKKEPRGHVERAMSHPANYLCYRFSTSQAQSLPALLCTCRSHRSKVHAALPWCAWSHCSPGRLQRRPHQLPLSLPALRALLAWNMSAEGKSSTFQMCNWRGAGARTKISGLDRCEALHRKAAQAIPHLARHARPDHKVMDMKGMNITTPCSPFLFHAALDFTFAHKYSFRRTSARHVGVVRRWFSRQTHMQAREIM